MKFCYINYVKLWPFQIKGYFSGKQKIYNTVPIIMSNITEPNVLRVHRINAIQFIFNKFN